MLGWVNLGHGKFPPPMRKTCNPAPTQKKKSTYPVAFKEGRAVKYLKTSAILKLKTKPKLC